MWHAFSICTVVSIALSLLLKNLIPPHWRATGFIALYALTLLPLLYVAFKQQSQSIRVVEEEQLSRLDQPHLVFGTTHHGVIFANEQGLAITYMPDFEVFLDWEEITGYVLFQKDIETFCKGFTKDWTKPPTLPGRAHTLLITSTRPDMPAVPIEIHKADLEFWSDAIDSGKTDPSSFVNYAKKPSFGRMMGDQNSLRAKVILCWIVLISFGLAWQANNKAPGSWGSMMLFFNWACMSQVVQVPTYISNLLRPSILQTLLRARGQSPNPSTDLGISDGVIWLCLPGRVLDQIPVHSVEHLTLESSKFLGSTTATLTFNLTSGESRSTTLKPEAAATFLTELHPLRPDLTNVSSPTPPPEKS